MALQVRHVSHQVELRECDPTGMADARSRHVGTEPPDDQGAGGADKSECEYVILGLDVDVFASYKHAPELHT